METQLHNVKYVCLTDAIANYKRGGSVVFEALAEDQKRSMYGEQPRTWKIQMLCDMWGNPYKPGDTVEWETKGPIVVRGRKLNNQQIKDMIRRGERSKLFFKHSYTVDSDGCIECGFTDAGYLLRSFGIHYSTGVALTSKREKSRSETVRPDGTKAQRHNWRCKEALPIAGPVVDSDGRKDETNAEAPTPKKRGRKPSVKKTETIKEEE